MNTVTYNSITPIECSARSGVTIGLIDAIMSISTVLRERLLYDAENTDTHSEEFHSSGSRYGYAPEVESALEDLQQHEPLYGLLQQIGYNGRIVSQEERKMIDLAFKDLKTKS